MNDFFLELLKTTNEWIQNADVKAGIVLAFNAAIFELFLSKFPNFALGKICLTTFADWLVLLLIIYVVTFAYSIYHAFRALKPNIKNQSSSVIFFGNIANMPLETFQREMSSLNEKTLGAELTEQIHANSVIASNKHKNLQRAIISLILSLIFYGVFILLNHIVL